MSEWVLRNINPTTFNVLSDLMAQAITGVLLCVLWFAYPHLVWRSVKRGDGVALENLMAPPNSLLEAITRFKNGGSRRLLFAGVFVLLVATFAHPAADIFLKFESVQVSTTDAQLLGSQTVQTPATYSLIGDKATVTISYPEHPVQKLLSEADDIVQGLSRFSILTESPLWEEFPIFEGNLTGHVLELTDAGSFEGKLGVQCKSHESIAEGHIIKRTVTPLHLDEDEVPQLERIIPNCDYEKDLSMDQVDVGVQEWRVIDRISLVSRLEFFDIGFLIEGEYDTHLALTADETMLPILREDWKLGRKIRDNLGIVLGSADNGVTIQVQHSVVSSVTTDPVRSQVQDSTGTTYWYAAMMYTVSSWSQICPVIDDQSKQLSVVDYSLGKDGGPTGCLIDTRLGCHVFPDDDFTNVTDPTLPEVYWRRCYGSSVEVTHLEGITVDPVMLAVYSGMYFRNAPNTAAHFTHVPLNALASAYVMTRDVVDGALAVYGVRPTINLGYLFLMIIPFVVAIPLLLSLLEAKPPVPNNVWKVMVFGRSTESAVPAAVNGDYPPQPPLMFGIIKDDQRESHGHIGLGKNFVPRSHPQKVFSGSQTWSTTVQQRAAASYEPQPVQHYQQDPDNEISPSTIVSYA